MATNLWLVMRKHRKAKIALREFSHSKDTFNLGDVKVIKQLEDTVQVLEDMLMVFVPKNFLSEQLKELQK
jgi:hypothetical protein